MRRFAQLFWDLDGTTRTGDKVELLRRYFVDAPPADAVWALYFLTGRKLKRLVNTRLLREWATAETGLPLWLIEQAYEQVGDLAETIAWLLPPHADVEATNAPATKQTDAKQTDSEQAETEQSTPPHDLPLSEVVEHWIRPLGEMSVEQQAAHVRAAWRVFDERQRLIFHKLISGGFRVGVAQTLVIRALAEAHDVPAATMAHRLSGDWEPTAEAFVKLIGGDAAHVDPARPYPFFLAYPLDGTCRDLGAPADWQAEWKWDGIRGQAVRRGTTVALWSRGEELVTDRFPELKEVVADLPDGTVVDGEILAYRDGLPMPFAALQTRIGRTKITAKALAAAPVVFQAYDLLEADGVDLRAQPLAARRAKLEAIVAAVDHPKLLLSPVVPFADWPELERLYRSSRERRVEGFMLKRRDAPYGVGRQKGPWWKWKSEPYAMDAVLIYAQAGHGKRAGLYTDYTFGVWDMRKLVPVAKAYSGLTDAEIREVDTFIRAHTIDKFGPVRVVEPQLVFELHFEGIQRSTRHKSGLAVRFPRMHSWRRDKPPAEADTLDTLNALIDGVEAGARTA